MSFFVVLGSVSKRLSIFDEFLVRSSCLVSRSFSRLYYVFVLSWYAIYSHGV